MNQATVTTLHEDIDRVGEIALRIAGDRAELLKALRALLAASEMHGVDSEQFFDARNGALELLARLGKGK